MLYEARGQTRRFGFLQALLPITAFIGDEREVLQELPGTAVGVPSDGTTSVSGTDNTRERRIYLDRGS